MRDPDPTPSLADAPAILALPLTAGANQAPPPAAGATHALPPAGGAVLAFALGLAAGSFVNVLIHRVPRGQSVVNPPSACPHCGRRLAPRDLIPLVSFVRTRGRCRYCGAPISWQYPLVEAGCAAGFAALWLALRRPGSWAAYATLMALLVALAAIDLRHRTLPNRLTVAGLASGLLFAAAGWTVGLGNAVAGAAVGGLALVALAVASRGGVGMGDAKLLAMIGAYLGPWGALGTLVWASLAGTLVGAGLVLARRVGLRQPVPFGPFLALGTLLSALTVPAWLARMGLR